MKKLLILVPCISHGGLEAVAVTTAEALQHQYDVTLVYFYSSETEMEIDPNIHKICLDVPYSLTPLGQIAVMLKRHFALRRLHKKLRPDICFSIGKTASISNILAKGKARCIASLHGYSDVPQTTLSALFMKCLFGRADKVLCVSRALTQELIETSGLVGGKVVTCINPFDLPLLTAKRDDIAHAPMLSGTPKLFAYGRLVAGKNFELALEAVALLKEDYPDLCLSIAGDGEHRTALQTMVQELHIEKQVCFLGMLGNPFSALKQADILVNSSWNEGFGNTIVESFLCGVPVIATDCKVGPRENIAPDSDIKKVSSRLECEEYGILIPPSYPTDTLAVRRAKAATLAEAIQMLWQDAPLRKRYAEKGIAHMSHYALPRYVAELTKILEN